MSNSSSVLEKSLSSSSSELMGCRGQFFSDLFKQFPDPCWIISEGLFVDCNYAAAQIMGYEQELPDFPIHPADISPLLQPDGQNSKHKAIKMLCLGWQKGSHRFEWVHQTKQPPAKSWWVCIMV